jgi:hypothetical protein
MPRDKRIQASPCPVCGLNEWSVQRLDDVRRFSGRWFLNLAVSILLLPLRALDEMLKMLAGGEATQFPGGHLPPEGLRGGPRRPSEAMLAHRVALERGEIVCAHCGYRTAR